MNYEEKLRSAVAIANVPTLLMVLVQLTGDLRWLDDPYRPQRGRGLDDNDSGGLPESIQQEIRQAAVDALLAHHRGQPIALPTPKPDLCRRMISVCMGEETPPTYGHIVAAELAARVPRPGARPLLGLKPGFKVLIVGAGISGICAAVHLLERGIDFVIVEKGETFGGTWRENRYPAAGVDTPNHLYSFSFAPKDWSRYFALQGEILEYLNDVARSYDLERHTHFGTSVTEARFVEENRQWQVDTLNKHGSPTTYIADAVFSAVGILNIPKKPKIHGLETFPGVVCHTAEWPDDLDVANRRVAVVGNGASAMQIVPAIADDVERLTIFARSKQWAVEFPQFHKRVPDLVRWLLQTVPLYQKWYRQRLAWTFNDRIHITLQKDPDWPHPDRSINRINEKHRQMFTAYVRRELGDRQDLLDVVLPDYPPYGKRILLDNGWYRTISKPNVDLIAHPLVQVDGNTLTAGDGFQTRADVLILATGFKSTEIVSSFEVIGREDRRLKDYWDIDDARAYQGSTVPGFPNLFVLLGPNTGLGHGGSVVQSVERQVHFIMLLLEQLGEHRADLIEVREDACTEYNGKIDDAHDRMIWTHQGMDNWYKNKRGRVVVITPWRNDDFWHMTRKANLDHFRFS